MRSYYYVHRLRPNSTPGEGHKTTTAAEAAAEAERLAAQHPGDTFEVLQCLAITRTTAPSTFWLDGCGPTEPEPWRFDWSAAQGDHTHAAMDEGGCWWSYYQKPKALQHDFVWDDGSIDCQPFDHPPFPGDWKDSLQTRPVTPPPPEPGYIEITDPEEIIREGDEIRVAGPNQWLKCGSTVGFRRGGNPAYQYRRPDPTRRVVPIPEEYLPLPPLPEGKTQWVGRGRFAGQCHYATDRAIQYWDEDISDTWESTANLSQNYFHIEAV